MRRVVRPRHFLGAALVGAIAAAVTWSGGGRSPGAEIAWLASELGLIGPGPASRAVLEGKLAAAGFAPGAPAYLRIFKHESALEVWLEGEAGFRLFAAYPICRWSGGLGPKLAEGDRQAPEGFYRIARRQLNPASRHHLAFDLGFPNEYDRAHGRTGSYLMVHGGCSSAGCYAMTDRGVDDIYRIVEAALDGGQAAVPVHIFPFRMTGANRERLGPGHERWAGFWDELQAGYDAFEASGAPPRVSVAGGRYRIAAGQTVTKR